jgi:hypothetical protein
MPYSNQTNLALKGIIGLKAMAHITELTGDNNKTYASVADDYLKFWLDNAINKAANPPHSKLAYQDNNSHGLLYNLYADRLLGLNFVPQSVYDMQSNFYQTIMMKYGVPLDTRHNWTKSDWEMFCAAIANADTRDMLISRLAFFIGNSSTNQAFTDLYEADVGTFPPNGPVFTARPVQGGTFALLVLPSAK